jgi:hypothetical protein
MQGAVTVDAARRILRFQFERNATIGDWNEAQRIFLRLAEETGFRRALVDVRSQGAAGSQLELFEFARHIPAGMAFAVLSAPLRGDHQFVETVALNRGRNVRLFFGAEDEAIEWLTTRKI